jgi:TolB-like protein
LAESALISGITVHYIRGVNASKGKASPSSSLVVLPLENLSGDKEQDYFADGMTDDLIANLSKIRSLRVISRPTAMAYKLFAQLDAHLKSNMSRRST